MFKRKEKYYVYYDYDNYHYITNNIYEDKTENKKLQIACNKDYEIQIDGLLKEIDNVLSTFNEGINLVLFYEYFFSRNPISYKAKEELISKIKNVSKKYKNTLFFAPIFYILEKAPEKEYIERIINYSTIIETNHPFAKWDVNYDFLEITKDKKDWVANEVFVIFENEVILSHKKSVFFQEFTSKLLHRFYNYDFGFGLNNVLTKNNNLLNLVKIINKYISTQICKECQDELLFLRKYFIQFDESILISDNKKYFQEKKKLFKEFEDPKHMEKNLYLIFSNTMTTESILHTFKEESIISHVDPINNGIFSIKYNKVISKKIKESIKNINNLNENDYICLSNLMKRNYFNVISEIKYNYDKKDCTANNYRFTIEYFKIS